MSEPAWTWNGARWWKFDFHSHTPTSDDYGKGPEQQELKTRTPREWLLDYMRAGIDCVAVTDHNSGAWIDRLKEALEDLDESKPEGYRPLTLFPGVEISVCGGVHVLAVFGQDKNTADINGLLGAVGFSSTRGSCDAVTTKAFKEVVAAIHQADGIAIPAHVDDEERGLFRKLNWAEVLGSDAHHPNGPEGGRFPGSHCTWVKMGAPTLDGLRLALLDGALSVRRSDEGAGDPNQHASLVLESLEVTKARFMGRVEDKEGSPQSLKLALCPWLNTIIGGRGTGKSTLVEFLRLVLRRCDEIPEALASDLAKYQPVSAGRDRDGDGVLTDDTRLVAIYRKDGARFKIQWDQAGSMDPIMAADQSGGWVRAEGQIPTRFPARIYSQKQIFQLAKAPGALLRVVDDAPEVDRRGWDLRWQEEERRFLVLRARSRELATSLKEESALRGELDDIERRLKVFEETGHADVLKRFQQRRRQHRVVETWEDEWSDLGERVRQLAADVLPEPLESLMRASLSSEDEEMLSLASKTRARLEEIRHTLHELSMQADEVTTEWITTRKESPWQREVNAALRAYEELKQKLYTEAVGDPAAFGQLVQNRQTVEQRLRQVAERKKLAVAVEQQASESLGRLVTLRRELTAARQRFLQEILAGNDFVNISVKAYEARDAVEAEVRKILGREGGGFEKDIGRPDEGGLLAEIYANVDSPAQIEAGLEDFKEGIRAVASDAPEAPAVRDTRFAAHLTRLAPETLDRLDLWFPGDSLVVKYSATSDGQNFRSIQEGSPGQKTAALLAFLLSYGEEPLVLDQPEDDLDNHLIYGLIVAQLRRVKSSRQLIVVTHNPNIVVNGDAELVVALKPVKGQTYIEAEGGLQDRKVRETICQVMEGGREAFERRYRRIALESKHD